MPVIALKIDVDTYRGTREGVPNLIQLLKSHQANATFLFSLGADHTGWALRRALRPGFFSKVSRTSVVEHYGLKTLMYGVLLPAPDIGKSCEDTLRTVKQAGFECGIHTWDHVVWQDHVRNQDAAWTTHAMQQAYDRFVSIFGHAPATHGAAGWQMNPFAFQQLDAFGMQYASDGRAPLNAYGALLHAEAGPYRLNVAGHTHACVQIPTTLPTMDELLGRKIGGVTVTANNIDHFLLQLTAVPRHHVYTLHAELEGQKLAPIFSKLLRGWQAQGYDLVALGDYYQHIDVQRTPILPLQWGQIPGRSGELVLQAA